VTPWITVLVAGALTYAIRMSMLVVVHHDALPALARESLRYVTAAVLAAIILPAVLYAGDDLDATLGNERLLAAIAAAAVAWATRSVWPTIAAGMGALWLLQWAA
jgi:branched-subunit amino acid transport protein